MNARSARAPTGVPPRADAAAAGGGAEEGCSALLLRHLGGGRSPIRRLLTLLVAVGPQRLGAFGGRRGVPLRGGRLR